MPYDEWSLTVGEVTAPFSRFGEVKVRLETDFPDRFARLETVCLRWPDGGARLYRVLSTRLHKGQVLLKLPGIESINDAETLRGALVQVRAEDAMPLGDNEFYVYDLLGCEVITADGRVLGPLTDVRRTPAHDVYVIGKGRDEIMLPAVRHVVQSVDTVARRIVVTPTPGLLGDAEEA